ncbi:MAG: phospho-N-acetylmuramoyl-pentapeptide-transferase [Bacteroidota bacterium]|nr:phospho-N-acetylmuramoyl-pentapeptide-transferase [Bacteroidota bacterium]MDP4204699.1 phospho-N-acetylmuramoyl-pentapeptide-transferase [Bacteroidota bacterium]
MLYYLFQWLHKLDVPATGMFHYISFRSAMSIILSLIIGTVWGRRLIRFLQKQQIGEEIRNLGLEGQMQKKGTPTMGGIIILSSILIPTLLFARLDNIYVVLMVITTVWLGLIGFIDDYIKVFLKNKEGLAGRFKIIGQVGLGLIIAGTLYFNDNVVIREKVIGQDGKPLTQAVVNPSTGISTLHYVTRDLKSTSTTIPFIKNQEFDYNSLVSWLGSKAKDWSWLMYMIVITLIITAVSNSSNLTDGLDGLATGLSAISGATLGILAYVSGHLGYAEYLNIMYIPNTGELAVFISAFIGATIGFLWYNSFPAQVFMGDTGSLALGGIIAVFAVIIRKEFLIPIMCGIFFVESLSVIVQVAYFKYTKRKYGEGRRIFLMSPIHHHFQKKGIPEPKIVARFWIIGIILAVVAILTLKTR